jgi:glutathionyl-hydroquinone reductase
MSATVLPSVPHPAPDIRGRIGGDPRYGHYAVPRRYRLHLCRTGPDCLRIAVTHAVLGLGDAVPVDLLPARPDRPDGGYLALEDLYEASSHLHPGPTAAPVLSDSWAGRIVSTYAPDVLRDLAVRFGGDRPDFRPRHAEADVEALTVLADEGVTAAAARAARPGPAAAPVAATLVGALAALERRLHHGDFLSGGAAGAADVHVWVTLMMLDTVHRPHLPPEVAARVAQHPRVWAYARRLAGMPAFGAHPDLDGIAARYHARCRCTAASARLEPLVPHGAYAAS